MKAVQFFTDDYLAQCAKMTPTEIAIFLDDFRQIHGATNHLERSPRLEPDTNPETNSHTDAKYE